MLSDKSSVFLSLGSNLGRREAQLRSAVARLAAFLAAIRVSSIYETQPLYVNDQPMFLNIVLCGITRLTPREILKRTRNIEDAMGRDRSTAVAKGPRVLDIDILLCGDSVIREPDLVVPHPGMSERRFVLAPLLELEPDILDPRTGRPFARDLAALDAQGAQGAQGIYTYAPWEYTEQAGQG
jgi:2-amino-4-hydroxy-6-hydroxymethyldihydropteridine diphosphokinase